MSRDKPPIVKRGSIWDTRKRSEWMEGGFTSGNFLCGTDGGDHFHFAFYCSKCRRLATVVMVQTAHDHDGSNSEVYFFLKCPSCKGQGNGKIRLETPTPLEETALLRNCNAIDKDEWQQRRDIILGSMLLTERT